jgi:hypothetical protein
MSAAGVLIRVTRSGLLEPEKPPTQKDPFTWCGTLPPALLSAEPLHRSETQESGEAQETFD